MGAFPSFLFGKERKKVSPRGKDKRGKKKSGFEKKVEKREERQKGTESLSQSKFVFSSLPHERIRQMLGSSLKKVQTTKMREMSIDTV